MLKTELKILKRFCWSGEIKKFDQNDRINTVHKKAKLQKMMLKSDLEGLDVQKMAQNVLNMLDALAASDSKNENPAKKNLVLTSDERREARTRTDSVVQS